MTDLPAFHRNGGPRVAERLRERQKQSRTSAAMIRSQLEQLEDAAAALFAVEDGRAQTRDRLHALAEKKRSRRGRD